MPLANDRDLLAIEPNLFRDVPYQSQQRLTATDGGITGTTLTSASSDFEAAAVDVGSIVLIDELPIEVIERTSATSLTVSLLRTTADDAAIAPAPGSDLKITVRTFRIQAEAMHNVLLNVLGIEEGELNNPGVESIIVTDSLRKVEVLGTLERIYAGAFALTGKNEPLRDKVRHYRRRFHAACASTNVLLDMDGDGRADVRRHLGIARMHRV